MPGGRRETSNLNADIIHPVAGHRNRGNLRASGTGGELSAPRFGRLTATIYTLG